MKFGMITFNVPVEGIVISYPIRAINMDQEAAKIPILSE